MIDAYRHLVTMVYIVYRLYALMIDADLRLVTKVLMVHRRVSTARYRRVIMVHCRVSMSK